MKPDIGMGYMRFLTCGRHPKRKENSSGSTDMQVSGWMVASPSVLHLNSSQRRLSHETDLEPTEKHHDEMEYAMEFSLDDAHRNDCEKGFSGTSSGKFGVILGVVEEEEEIKDNSGETETFAEAS